MKKKMKLLGTHTAKKPAKELKAFVSGPTEDTPHQLTTYLPNALYEKVRTLCFQEKQSIASLVRALLEAHLKAPG